MRNEKTDGKYNITQRPEKQRKFSTAEMATALGVTFSMFYRLRDKLGLAYTRQKVGRTYVTYFDYSALCQCRAALGRAGQLQEDEQRTKNEKHPLVTDPRCLDFNYWPDVVPDCFKECEGE